MQKSSLKNTTTATKEQNSASVGSIFIEDLRFQCIIGILPHERTEPQELRIELQFQYDFATASAQDSAEFIIDYAQIRVFIIEFCQKAQFQLLETLVMQLCQQLLQKYKTMTYVAVKAAKPEALPGSAICAAYFEQWAI
jgi:7,8-dihydroneopterin aldolase/epimerase/oxygenase